MMHSLWCVIFILWLPNYNAWKETNKIMASIAHQMDKANLREAHRLGELLFFTCLLLLTFFMGTAFLIEACSFTYDHKVFITNSYFALKERGFCRNAGHAVINMPLLSSSGVSQQLQYFHKSFLNKLQIKKEAWIKSKAKVLRSLSCMWAPLGVDDLWPCEEMLVFPYNHCGSLIRLGRKNS